MKNALSFGPLFVVAAALLWSLDGLLRISLLTIPPSVIVFYEHALGFIFLVPFAFIWIRDLKKMTKSEWIGIVIVALFSGALGTILYTSALSLINYTQYSVVVLLQQQLQPIWAIAAAALLLKERITKSFLVYAGLALVAAYFVTFSDLKVNLATGSATAIAGLFALGAGFVWGTSTAISKLVLNKVSFITGTTLRFFFAPIFAFIFVLAQGQEIALGDVSLAHLQTLLIITFSTGMLALLIYYYGLKRTPARIATLCELIWPASAVMIDYFYFHKALTATQILGIIVLLFAVYKVTREVKNKSVK